MIHFKAHEFVKLSGHSVDMPISVGVADKIKDLIFELNPVRKRVGKPVIVTSSYRPSWWEHYKGRSGNSEHTFEDKGAVDLTVLQPYMKELAHSLIEITNFNRIAFYPNSLFFHVDYKNKERGKTLFISRNNKWEMVNQDTFIETVKSITY